MANTFIKIASVNVGSGGANGIEFTSIPQNYTDLMIMLSARRTGTVPTGMYITFNGSTSNFTGLYINSDSTSVSSASLARYIGSILGTDHTALIFNSTQIYIPNYSSANYKTFFTTNVTENNGAYGNQNVTVGLWSQTTALTSVGIDNNDFAQYSTATLYGIKSS